MLAKPIITIAWSKDGFVDEIGQRWSPANVRLEWSAPQGLENPSVTVRVIALSRGDMSNDQLEGAHLQAVRDVLSAALLAVEEPIYQDMLSPPHRVMTKGN
jgi:hypothetical protein